MVIRVLSVKSAFGYKVAVQIFHHALKLIQARHLMFQDALNVPILICSALIENVINAIHLISTPHHIVLRRLDAS